MSAVQHASAQLPFKFETMLPALYMHFASVHVCMPAASWCTTCHSSGCVCVKGCAKWSALKALGSCACSEKTSLWWDALSTQAHANAARFLLHVLGLFYCLV